MINLNRILCSLLLLAISVSSFAVPAYKGTLKVVQVDGTTIEVRMHGDEYYGWMSTTNGYPIIKKDGFYHYATIDNNGQLLASGQRVTAAGSNRMQTPAFFISSQEVEMVAERISTQRRALRPNVQKSVNFPCTGLIKSAIILVEYQDLKFSVDNPHQAFSNQLNEEGYSVEGATGSAKDYFAASSGGQFEGQFDVYGPYTLAHNQSYYGGVDNTGMNDAHAWEMIAEGVELADKDGVDFSEYDYDNNGLIDNVFVYYAGHNEAEGAGSNTVWPHKWEVESMPVHDGKKLFGYACTSELRGNQDAIIAGIGTFCHEFGHVFGLNDHYDTNYTQQGYSPGFGNYDIMTSGSYNNNGNTPPLHNTLELEMIGWSEAKILDKNELITISPISEKQECYKVLTEVEGEYFLIENRQQDASIWDKYIPGSGLIISHIDRSEPQMNKWETNTPNADYTHECAKFVVAGNFKLNQQYSDWSLVPYPCLKDGNNNWSAASSPRAKSWRGETPSVEILDIERQGLNVSFKVRKAGAKDYIEVKQEVGDAPAYVGFEIQLLANSQDISWSTSNETIATVSDNGLVDFISEGEVQIIATSNSDSENTTTVNFDVKEVSGIWGYITNTDGDNIKPTEVNIYPLTTGSKGYQRVAGTVYSATIYSNGMYLSSELPTSRYEVEVISSSYAESMKQIEYDGTLTSLDFVLNNYPRLDIVAGQSEAYISWPNGNLGLYDITVTDIASGEKYEYESTSCECIASGLNPKTKYSITINDLYEGEFTTIQSGISMPMVLIPQRDYRDGDVLTLRTLNSKDGDQIEWFVDGEKAEREKITLHQGVQKIKCSITRSGNKFNVIRTINIR